MKTNTTCSLLITMLVALTASAQSVVLNINSAVSGYPEMPTGTPVTHFLSAGTYSCTLISPAQSPEAQFSDWTAWDTVPDSDYRLVAYAIAYTDGAILATAYEPRVLGPVGAAFNASTNKTLYFTLTNDAVLRFGVVDFAIGDNSGGVSLLIRPFASTMTIEFSDVRICWTTVSNVTYQAEYQSELTTNMWVALGPPIVADGTKSCVFDSILVQPKRFYRVREVR